MSGMEGSSRRALVPAGPAHSLALPGPRDKPTTAPGAGVSSAQWGSGFFGAASFDICNSSTITVHAMKIPCKTTKPLYISPCTYLYTHTCSCYQHVKHDTSSSSSSWFFKSWKTALETFSPSPPFLCNKYHVTLWVTSPTCVLSCSFANGSRTGSPRLLPLSAALAVGGLSVLKVALPRGGLAFLRPSYPHSSPPGRLYSSSSQGHIFDNLIPLQPEIYTLNWSLGRAWVYQEDVCR